MAPVGDPVDKEIYIFLTQVRRGIMRTLTEEQTARLASRKANLEVEARLGLIHPLGSNTRATHTVPGSGAISRDMQEMKQAQYEFVGGVSGPAFNAIKGGAAALYAVAPAAAAPGADPAAAALAAAAAAARIKGECRVRVGAAPGVGCAQTLSADTVYTYEDGARVVVADAGTVRRETKDAKLTMNFQLPSAPYDFRVMVSVEDAQEPAAADAALAAAVRAAAAAGPAAVAAAAAAAAPPGWRQRRRRRRATWQSPREAPPEAALHWRLDASMVDVSEQLPGGEDAGLTEDSQVLEVELELQPHIQAQWLGAADEEQADLMTKHLALALFRLIGGIDPLEPLSLIADPPRETRLDVAASAKSKCQALRNLGRGGGGGGGGGGDGFPGAMPVNMCRADIAAVQGGAYFISEKTDGVRYLLVVTEEGEGGGACVLVDRKMGCFAVAGGAALAKVFGAGTVLDGELVHRSGAHGAGAALAKVFGAGTVLDGELCTAAAHPARAPPALACCASTLASDAKLPLGLSAAAAAPSPPAAAPHGAPAADATFMAFDMRVLRGRRHSPAAYACSPRTRTLPSYTRMLTPGATASLRLNPAWLLLAPPRDAYAYARADGAPAAEATFMAFDMLALRGRPLLAAPFKLRFQQVANQITAPYLAALAGAEGAPTSLKGVPHLRYAQKRFFARSQVGDLLRCVARPPGAARERLYLDARDGRSHRTDGVIFQPDAPYVVGTHRALLKWKWLDVASVDLRAASAEGALRLTTEAQGGAPVDVTGVVALARHDAARLTADMRAAAAGRGAVFIAEVAHDRATGAWVYLGRRPDKDRPNFVTTVMATLVELAEGIGEEELVYRMAVGDAAEDEWDKQSRKYARVLRDWQLEEQRKKAARLQQQQQQRAGAAAAAARPPGGGGARP
ncbi:hypothetical protein JKP88DRAFT_353262 [Tribonema minus]|uniref:mRNA capping enzyme adenylation domain-containing protein n=1 Tax=Tribonema minus TaxID=303371 RepID=A0A835ZHC0_9STRA|nr:hypothetical protein JKP88DRAFT_353262 [Tribonema minus]